MNRTTLNHANALTQCTKCERSISCSSCLDPNLLASSNNVKNQNASPGKTHLFVIGGCDKDGKYQNQVQRFDFEKDTWTSSTDPDYLATGGSSVCIPTMTFKGRSYCKAVLAENCVYVVGGFVGEEGKTKETLIYDLNKREWQQGPKMNQKRLEHGLARIGDQIFAIGGLLNDTCEMLEIFALGAGWRMIAKLNIQRFGLCAVALDNKIFAIGGWDLSSTECYDLQSNIWTDGASMNDPRADHSAAVLNNLIYVVGGNNSTGKTLKTAEFYDPKANRWTLLSASLNTSRQFSSMVAHAGHLYIMGGRGEKQKTPLATVERYDPCENKWTLLSCQMKTPVYLAALVLIRDS